MPPADSRSFRPPIRELANLPGNPTPPRDFRRSDGVGWCRSLRGFGGLGCQSRELGAVADRVEVGIAEYGLSPEGSPAGVGEEVEGLPEHSQGTFAISLRQGQAIGLPLIGLHPSDGLGEGA